MQWEHIDAEGDVAFVDDFKLRIFEIAGIGWTGSVRRASLPNDENSLRPKEWLTKPNATKESARCATLELFENVKSRGDNENFDPKRPEWRNPPGYLRRKYKTIVVSQQNEEPTLTKVAFSTRARHVINNARAMVGNKYSRVIKAADLQVACKASADEPFGRSLFYVALAEAEEAHYMIRVGKGLYMVKPPTAPKETIGNEEFIRRRRRRRFRTKVKGRPGVNRGVRNQ